MFKFLILGLVACGCLSQSWNERYDGVYFPGGIGQYYTYNDQNNYGGYYGFYLGYGRNTPWGGPNAYNNLALLFNGSSPVNNDIYCRKTTQINPYCWGQRYGDKWVN